MSKILLINGHPDFQNSVSNSRIIETFSSLTSKNGLNDEVQIRNLNILYPDYKINIKEEQGFLLDAQLIILQFPFYWYSVPALLKLWIDMVLTYGFAYGKTGTKLHGKKLLLSLTTGGPENAYHAHGRNNYEIIELLSPLKQMSNLIGTEFLEPLISYSMVNISGIESDTEYLKRKADEHGQLLFDVLSLLNYT